MKARTLGMQKIDTPKECVLEISHHLQVQFFKDLKLKRTEDPPEEETARGPDRQEPKPSNIGSGLV